MKRLLWGVDPLRFFLGLSAFAWAIGLAKYLGVTIWTSRTINSVAYSFGSTPYPVWPNILDVVGMSLIGFFLLWEAWLPRRIVNSRRRLADRERQQLSPALRRTTRLPPVFLEESEWEAS